MTRKNLSGGLLRDERAEQLQKYVEKKRQAHPKEVVVTRVSAEKGEGAEVIDMMSILKKSLEKHKRQGV